MGYDIGCGNKAARTELTRIDLEGLGGVESIMREIVRRISFGMGLPAHERVDHPVLDRIRNADFAPQRKLAQLAESHLGTVGSGNHYVNLMEDEDGRIRALQRRPHRGRARGGTRCRCGPRMTPPVEATAGVSASDLLMTESVREAQLKKTEVGLLPQGEGWFVLNARDATWIRSEERGQDTDFQGGQEWAQLGFRIQVVAPGQRGMYHGERGQEDFLVVSGECVLVIEGEERRLKPWDFVHCPPWTQHVFVGAGDRPCVIVMTGSRAGGFEALYPVNEVAAKHDASVLEETSNPQAAYARFGQEQRSAYRDGWLP